MAEELLKRLGSVKQKYLKEHFDEVLETYQKKALELGFGSELRFIKEHGQVIIYAKVI